MKSRFIISRIILSVFILITVIMMLSACSGSTEKSDLEQILPMSGRFKRVVVNPYNNNISWLSKEFLDLAFQRDGAAEEDSFLLYLGARSELIVAGEGSIAVQIRGDRLILNKSWIKSTKTYYSYCFRIINEKELEYIQAESAPIPEDLSNCKDFPDGCIFRFVPDEKSTFSQDS